MTTPLSMIARKAELTGLRNGLDLGGGAALYYTGTPPATSDTPTSANLLATLAFATPCGAIGESGGLATLTMVAPQNTSATASGTVGWVRLVDGAGNGFMDLRVGLPLPPGSTDTPAPVIVNALQLYAGGQVTMLSCVLAK